MTLAPSPQCVGTTGSVVCLLSTGLRGLRCIPRRLPPAPVCSPTQTEDADVDIHITVGTRKHVIRTHLNIREYGSLTIPISSLTPHVEVSPACMWLPGLCGGVCSVLVLNRGLCQETNWYRTLDSHGGKSCIMQWLQLSFRWSYRAAPFTGPVPEYKCVAGCACALCLEAGVYWVL